MLDILVVDDHPVMRAGLECVLGSAPDLSVVGTAADGAEALRLAGQLHPDVVLLDLSMPGMDGLDATRLLVQLDPAPEVVVLTSTSDAVTVTSAFTAGAAGYLLKDMAPSDLLVALRGLAQGRAAIDPRAGRILARRRRAAQEAQAQAQALPD